MDDRDPFVLWMLEVDSVLSRYLGITTADVPNCPFVGWYTHGANPRRAATLAVSFYLFPTPRPEECFQ